MKKLILIFFILLATSSTHAGWYNEDWSYRISGTVSGNDVSSADNYEAQIDIYRNQAMIEDNGIFEWFQRPVDRYNGTYDRTYFAYYDTTSRIHIRYWDANSKILSESIQLWSSWGAGDDHGAPSVLVLRYQAGDKAVNNGKILVAAAEHGGRLQSRRSTAAENITAFDAAVIIETTGMSYAQLCETSDGTVWLFCRQTISANLNTNIYKSTTSGASWDPAIQLTSPSPTDIGNYCMVYEDGEDIHAMFNVSDITCTPSCYYNIYYATYDGSDDRWETIEGTALTLPIDSGDVDLVFTTDSPTRRTFLWDIIADNGVPHLISCDGVRSLTVPLSYNVQHHWWDGDSWETETVCTTQTYGDYRYPSGAVFAYGEGDAIYACVQDGSNCTQLQKWEKAGTWSKTVDCTTGLPGDAMRPISVRHGGGLFQVLYCYTELYTNFTSGDWTSSLFAYPGFSNQFGAQTNSLCQLDYDDIRFTASDGVTLIDTLPVKETDFTGLKIAKTVYFPVPADGSPDETVYMYYGNTTCDSIEDLEIIAASDYSYEFSDTSYLDDWSDYEGTSAVSAGALVLESSASAKDRMRWDTPLALGYEYTIKARMDRQYSGYAHLLCESDAQNTAQSIQYYFNAADYGAMAFSTREDGSTSSPAAMPINSTYDNYQISYVRRYDASRTVYGVVGAGRTEFTTATQIPDGTMYWYLGPFGGGTSTMYVDLIAVKAIEADVLTSAPDILFSNIISEAQFSGGKQTLIY